MGNCWWGFRGATPVPIAARMLPDTVASRLAAIHARIAKAAALAARDAADVTLVAVSKTHEPDAITPLIEAGARVFGENRVQEEIGRAHV